MPKATNLMVNCVNVGSLRPMSEADIWGYYDGTMPELLVFDINRAMHIVSYDRRVEMWRDVNYNRVFFSTAELIGWMPKPFLKDFG